MRHSLKNNLGLVAFTTTAWVSGGELSFAQDTVTATNFGTRVVNIATIDFTVADQTSSVSTNAAVFTIRPPQQTAKIEFFRYAPNAPSPVFRTIRGSDYSPTGSLEGPFEPIGEAVTIGGEVLDFSGETPLKSVTTYLSGELMIVSVTDMGQNLNSDEIDTVSVQVKVGEGGNLSVVSDGEGPQKPEFDDEIIVRLYETGVNSGEFLAYMPSTTETTSTFDNIVTVQSNSQLSATYIDALDQSDVVVDTAIVNPLNRVFSSVTGAPVDDAVITITNLETNVRAAVLGVDGFSTFPSSVTSGQSVSDGSGLTYEVGPGEFRFPVLEAGRYKIDVETPVGYTFSSVRNPEDLRTVGGGGFVITPGSFGQEFVFDETSPLRFDIPVDPDGALLLTKTADRNFGDVGDYVNYTVTVENKGSFTSPIEIYDTLPFGFRYMPGTTRISALPSDEPEISPDGTTLEFYAGELDPGESVNLTYALSIGPGAVMGDAVNEAIVKNGNGVPISNLGRAAITIREDLFRSTSSIVGRMAEQACDGDQEWAREITQGVGVPGVRLYMETGAYTVSDENGLFHFEGVTEGTHVIQVDEATLPDGFELMQCEENTRYAGAMNSKFIDVQGGGIWRTNFYLKQTGKREVEQEDTLYNDRTDYKRFDETWIETQTADIEWVYPATTRTPSSPSIHMGIKHGPQHTVSLIVNERPIMMGNYTGREGNKAKTVYLSRWRSVDLVDGKNVIVATIKDTTGNVVKTLRREVHFVKTISRAIPVPDQSTLIADGRTVPTIAIRMEDQAGHAVHAGRITSLEVEPPYRLYDETGNADVTRQSQDLIAPLSARRDFAVGPDGIVQVKLEPTLRTGKVTVIATLDNGRKIPVYMYLAPEKRDWILVGLAEGMAGWDQLKGNSIAIEANGGGAGDNDLVTDGRMAFFAKGLIKGNWLMSLAVDTDKGRADREGDFNSEIDPNAYYTLYGDRSYQEFEGVSRYPVYVKLEKSQAYAMFGDYNTNISEGRLTGYNRQLSGLKAEYIGENLQVLGFAAETNQGFAQDEIAADGTSGTYQLSNDRLLAQSERIVIETRDRFRPDIILERKTLVRFLDYTLDYLTGQLIFRLPIEASDADFNPNVIVVEYETAAETEKNVTAGGRVQAEFLDDTLRIGSTFVHEEGSNSVSGAESNQIGIDVLAQITDTTSVRAEYAVTENNSDESESFTADAKLLEVIHTSETFAGEAYFREEQSGFGLGQTESNTSAVRRYGAKGKLRVSEFQDEETGRRGSRYIEAQLAREENLSTGDARNTADLLATHLGLRGSFSAGVRTVEDQFQNEDNRHSILAIGKASLDIPKHGIAFQISQEQPLSSKDEVSAFPMRTTLGIDKKLGNRANASLRHEILDGESGRSENTVFGISTSLWQGAELNANSDLLTQDSNRRLGATIGLDQTVQINDNWALSAGLRGRQILDEGASEFIEVAPDAAVSPVEINENFRSAYVGAAYRNDVMSVSARLEGRETTAEDSYIATASVAREVSDKLSLAGTVRTAISQSSTENENAHQTDMRLGAAWRPRDDGLIVFNRFDYGHSKEVTGQKTTKLVNNVAVNKQVTDRWQLSGNWGAKYTREDVVGEERSNYSNLLGVETRFDVTPKIDLGFRGQLLHSTSSEALSYSYGPSIGVRPAKNLWVSLGYNVKGFKDRDFEAAEFSRSGLYLQMRLKFDQNTARGLLQRISPANDIVDDRYYGQRQQRSFAQP